MGNVFEWIIAVAAVVFAGAQAVMAVIAYFDSRRQQQETEDRASADRARSDHRLSLEDRQVVLGLHRDLTTLEVQHAKKGAASPGEDRQFLTALYVRCAAQYELLNNEGSLDDYLAAEVQRELAAIQELDPIGTREATEVIDRKRGDRSRFVWDGGDTVSKHHTLQRIAQRFKAVNGIDDLAVFREKFGAQLREAVSPDLPFKPEGTLVEVERADGSHRAVAESATGPLVLDGVEYVVDHRLGFPKANYGTAVQLPVIAHFRAQGYPITDP